MYEIHRDRSVNVIDLSDQVMAGCSWSDTEWGRFMWNFELETYEPRPTRSLRGVLASLVIGLAPLAFISEAEGEEVITDIHPAKMSSTQTVEVRYKSININDVDIAYREAGDPDRATILLLHGFPTSSHMFRNLMPKLADRYHVLAPDYPGYGASEMPDPDHFEYSFAVMAAFISAFLDAKGVDTYTPYLMDFGAPIGYRLFEQHPERVSGFIIQNGNAYEEGLREFWDPMKTYWADPKEDNRDALRPMLTLNATKWQYTHGVADPLVISPDNWHKDQYLLDRPGNQDIQLDMFLNYASNVEAYPVWQAMFREHQPPALIVWGKNDHIFPPEGAHPYKRDLQNVEFHLLDTGHFALEDHSELIANEIKDFMEREIPCE